MTDKTMSGIEALLKAQTGARVAKGCEVLTHDGNAFVDHLGKAISPIELGFIIDDDDGWVEDAPGGLGDGTLQGERYCVDCRHMLNHYLCGHPKVNVIDLVTGKPGIAPPCRSTRYGTPDDTVEPPCGFDGKLWERKE